jgi:hypothetical protein
MGSDFALMLQLQARIQVHQFPPITRQAQGPPFKIRDKAAAAAPWAVGFEKIPHIILMEAYQVQEWRHHRRVRGLLSLKTHLYRFTIQSEPESLPGQFHYCLSGSHDLTSPHPSGPFSGPFLEVFWKNGPDFST